MSVADRTRSRNPVLVEPLVGEPRVATRRRAGAHRCPGTTARHGWTYNVRLFTYHPEWEACYGTREGETVGSLREAVRCYLPGQYLRLVHRGVILNDNVVLEKLYGDPSLHPDGLIFTFNLGPRPACARVRSLVLPFLCGLVVGVLMMFFGILPSPTEGERTGFF